MQEGGNMTNSDLDEVEAKVETELCNCIIAVKTDDGIKHYPDLYDDLVLGLILFT